MVSWGLKTNLLKLNIDFFYGLLLYFIVYMSSLYYRLESQKLFLFSIDWWRILIVLPVVVINHCIAILRGLDSVGRAFILDTSGSNPTSKLIGTFIDNGYCISFLSHSISFFYTKVNSQTNWWDNGRPNVDLFCVKNWKIV